MQSHEVHGATGAGWAEGKAGRSGELPRIRGLLRVYYFILVAFAVHNSVLTVGSVVTHVHSSASGSPHVSLPSLIFYIVSNVVLILYVLYLFRLMSRRRKSAITHNVVFNVLSVVFLLSWHLIGEKSTTGTIADSAPSLVLAAYFLLSGRVRRTFVVERPAYQSDGTPGRLSREAHMEIVNWQPWRVVSGAFSAGTACRGAA
jgi:hypothetical protein